MSEILDESCNSIKILNFNNMDTALGHARMAFGLSWVATDKNKRIYAFNTKPYRGSSMWMGYSEKTALHIGIYTGVVASVLSVRGLI